MKRRQRLAVLARSLAQIATSLAAEEVRAGLTPKERRVLKFLTKRVATKTLTPAQNSVLERLKAKGLKAADKDQDGTKLEDSQWAKVLKDFKRNIVDYWPKFLRDDTDFDPAQLKEALSYTMPHINNVAKLLKNKADAKTCLLYTSPSPRDS